jgi:leucyl aminopeptidase
MGSKRIVQKVIGYFITLVVGIWLLVQPVFSPQPQSADLETLNGAIDNTTPTLPERTETLFSTQETPQPTLPQPTATPTFNPLSIRPEPGSVCGFDPAITSLLEEFQQDEWVNWIELLSGEKPVTINDETYTIQTRFTESMFSGDPDARGYDFVISQLREWGYEDNINLFEQEFKPFSDSETPTWKNIILVFPGSDPDFSKEQVLLTAHLDSTAKVNPEESAPGADDNGSGVATLLEAARVFRDFTFKRTIKIIFFTGEEQGLQGSRAYVMSYGPEMDNILGVFNVDMFGYDADNDRCFEIHVGWMRDSNLVAGCLADTIEGYDFDLKFDYLVADAIGASDHSSFWRADVGAIEVLENFDTHNYLGGCGSTDINPNYHTQDDRLEAMNVETGHAIARAVIAAVARMAEIMEN